MSSRRRRRKGLMQLAFEREGGRCFYCNRPVSMEARIYLSKDLELARITLAATLDHLIPQSRRGDDSLENTVCACAECNFARRDRPAVDFLYEKISRTQPLTSRERGEAS